MTRPEKLTADDLLTAEQVAELLNVKTTTVHAWARSGAIPSVTLGRRVRRFRRWEIQEWIGGPRS